MVDEHDNVEAYFSSGYTRYSKTAQIPHDHSEIALREAIISKLYQDKWKMTIHEIQSISSERKHIDWVI